MRLTPFKNRYDVQSSLVKAHQWKDRPSLNVVRVTVPA